MLFLHRNINIPILPKIMPFSVEATLTCALMVAKSRGARTSGAGRSTSLNSPSVASSTVQFWRVSSIKTFYSCIFC